jgi:DnaJ-class molecular chaperone
MFGDRGPAGDLYVFLNVKEMPGIQRDGINLYSTISINYTEAIIPVEFFWAFCTGMCPFFILRVHSQRSMVSVFIHNWFLYLSLR